MLIVSTIVALIWSNGVWSAGYFALVGTKVGLTFANQTFNMSIGHWINDLLMALFFLVVGLEIKREVLIGELKSVRQAALPIAAAVGGMLVPALLFFLFNIGKSSVSGWGVPMATDIAFSLGVLALLGSRVPVGLKVCLTALAIVDDLGAVVVIAVAYTSSIQWGALAMAAFLLAVLATCNRLGVRNLVPYLAVGFGVWICFMMSGVHATIAGVLVAMTIPLWQRVPEENFAGQARKIINRYDDADAEGKEFYVGQLERICENVQMPTQRLEHLAHPWVTYLIIPLFALANAGVLIPANLAGSLGGSIPLGVIAGLLIGKPLGIVLASLLAVKLKMAELPESVNWRQMIGLGFLAGIGFTMSIFIANLAFSDADQVDNAKVGILVGSLLAGVVGFLILLKRSKLLKA